MQSGADGQASSEMTITNLAVRWHAMCCWMLMQSTRSTTQVRHLSHLDIPSISSSSRHFPSLSPSHHNEEGESTTMQQSQYACDCSNGRRCGGCGEGGQEEKREGEKRREEEAQYLTHSHMYHLLLVFTGVACRWRRIWAGGGGEERE